MKQGEIVLEPGPLAPRIARSEVSAAVGPIDPKRRMELELAVSELITNAVQHGNDGDALSIGWRSDRSTFRLEIPGGEPGVEDDPERWGWGLSLVDRICRRWGIEGKPPVTWLEMEIRPRTRVQLTDVDEEILFAQATFDESARDEVFERYLPLAMSIAYRFRGKGIDRSDIEQAASLALVKAINRFDPAQGAFPAYASRTISGELKRYLRDRGWSVRVPRSLQEASLDVGKASQHLTQRLGRAPTIEELAAETDRPPEEVVEALQAGAAYRAGSLDAPVGGEDGDLTLLDRLGSADENLRLADRWHELASSIEQLPERERRILYLRFYEDLTQSQIAEIIGISQMHVSRLLARSISRLKDLAEG